MSQANLHSQQLAEREGQSPTRTRILPFGWAVITLLFVLGAINFADKAVLGLAAVPIIKELHYLAVNIPSTLGAVTFFTLAATAGAAIPLLAAIVLDVTPQAHRGFFLGVIVALTTLPGFLAPSVTGLLVQAAENDASQGLHNAYVLAALLLLVCGVVFIAFVRPEEASVEASLGF